MGSGSIRRSDVYYGGAWDVDRAVKEALERVTWVYRCVDAIASNQMRLPMYLRQGDRFKGEFLDDHPLYKIFNLKANVGEHAAIFRYRLSAQFLLSRKGVFVLVVRNNGGDVTDLILLPPDQVEIIPDRKTFIKGYKHTWTDNSQGAMRTVTKVYKPEDIIWIRRPHPFNQYMGMTPLESAGLAIETEWLAKLYNRNFLVNDGRPGGIVVVKGSMEEADAEELRARFSGGVGKAGRITVISSETGADFVDTAVTPRDAQYQETRSVSKSEILEAFGVPQSVLGNAENMSFDSAEQERLIFWHETMKGHLELIGAPFDELDEDPNLFTAYDTSNVDVLQRAEIKRREFVLREFTAGGMSVNEYRKETSKAEISSEEADVLFIPKTSVPFVSTTGKPIGQDLLDIIQPKPPAGRPGAADTGQNDPSRTNEGDERLSPTPNRDNPAGAAQLSAAEAEEIRTKAAVVEKERSDLVAESAKYEKIAQANFDATDRWEFILKHEVGRIGERVGRVMSEKISGQKFKRAFFDKDDAVDKLFNPDVWFKQLSDDLVGIQRSAYNEGYKSVTGSSKSDFRLTSLASAHVKTIVEELRKAAEDYIAELEVHNDFRRATTEIKARMEAAANNISSDALHSLASEAYNKGVVDGCVKSGLRKMWWGNGNDLHLKTVEADELFAVGKTSYKFPPAHMTGNTIIPVGETNGPR